MASPSPQPSALVIAIKKKTDGSASLACRRADGSVTWQRQEGAQGRFFPRHDLTHYAVETVLGMDQAFYGVVASGWELSDFGPPWPRGPMPAEAIQAELIVGYLDAERAAGTTWSAEEFNAKAAAYHGREVSHPGASSGRPISIGFGRPGRRSLPGGTRSRPAPRWSFLFPTAGDEHMRFRILAAGLLVSCASSLTQVASGPDFELEPGKTVQLAGTGVRVTFLEVVNDSRCPVDVVCVTAGDAEVRLAVAGEGEDRTVALHVMGEPRSITIGAVRLELTGLVPSPRSTVTISPQDYRATIRWSAP